MSDSDFDDDDFDDDDFDDDDFDDECQFGLIPPDIWRQMTPKQQTDFNVIIKIREKDSWGSRHNCRFCCGDYGRGAFEPFAGRRRITLRAHGDAWRAYAVCVGSHC